ncbi:MAG: hypothetical protein IT530_03570 [Burkholderiales bacterium]|nr:hypothetical protein [Burkholderiales bacterium]
MARRVDLNAESHGSLVARGRVGGLCPIDELRTATWRSRTDNDRSENHRLDPARRGGGQQRIPLSAASVPRARKRPRHRRRRATHRRTRPIPAPRIATRAQRPDEPLSHRLRAAQTRRVRHRGRTHQRHRRKLVLTFLPLAYRAEDAACADIAGSLRSIPGATTNTAEGSVRKSDLEEQLESLQDVLTDIREMIYGALEPTDDEPETQIESLRNVLADIEDMIDSALEPIEMDEEEEEEEEEDDDR